MVQTSPNSKVSTYHSTNWICQLEDVFVLRHRAVGDEGEGGELHYLVVSQVQPLY